MNKICCTTNKVLFFSLFFSTATSCYHSEEVKKAIIIRNSKEMKYEIEVPVKYEGRGNIHQLDPSKYEFSDSYWIYSNEKNGTIKADSIVLTDTRYEINYPYKQSNLKGFIKFENDSVLLNLIFPQYKDSDSIPDGWKNWPFNGKYRIR